RQVIAYTNNPGHAQKTRHPHPYDAPDLLSVQHLLQHLVADPDSSYGEVHFVLELFERQTVFDPRMIGAHRANEFTAVQLLLAETGAQLRNQADGQIRFAALQQARSIFRDQPHVNAHSGSDGLETRNELRQDGEFRDIGGTEPEHAVRRASVE